MKEDEGNSGLLCIILDATCFDTQLNKIICRLFAISKKTFLFGFAVSRFKPLFTISFSSSL